VGTCTCKLVEEVVVICNGKEEEEVVGTSLGVVEVGMSNGSLQWFVMGS
jgi:hypothetical protein